jgi:DNA-binding NarL/FixJ family response regulator
LTISISTTKHHVSAIFSKLGVASRAEAIALALEQGLIRDSPSE